MGVPLAALTVFTYQGALTLLAAYGGVPHRLHGGREVGGRGLIMGSGVVKRLRVVNYLPASLLVVAILTMMGVGF